jgi:hypothetical protein
MPRLLALVPLLTSTTAFAQAPAGDVTTPATPDAPVTPQTDPARAPGFVTLDRFDANSRVGIESSYISLNNSQSGNSDTLLHFDVHGQWIEPHIGVGAYVEVPFAHLSQTSMDPVTGMSTSTSATGVGDIELGALYVRSMPAQGGAFVLRAGVSLPTAPTDLDSGAAVFGGQLARLTDFYLAIPDGLSGRLSGSVLVRAGHLFVRADLGIDGNKSTRSGGDINAFLHANAGVGYEVGPVAVMAESVNLFAFGQNDSTEFGSSWIDEGAISVRYHGGRIQPYLAVVLPIDHDSNQLINTAVTLGVDGALR